MYNKITLLGRLTKDPEIKYLPSGTSVCEFTVAIDTGYGERKKTIFLNCVAFGKIAEPISQYCSKGEKIFCEGELTIDEWQNDDTGQINRRPKVIVNTVKFLENNSNNNRTNSPSIKREDEPF